MAAGQQAFKGETSLGVRDAILDRAPAPVRELNPGVPRKLEAIIDRAVEKDREARYQRAADIRTDLKGLQRDVELGRRKAWRRAPVVAVLAGAVAIAGIALISVLRTLEPPPRIIRVTKFTNHRGGLGTFATDGFRLYFTEEVGGHSSLAAMPVKGGEIVPVPTPFKEVTLFGNSPDGSELLLAEGRFGQDGPLWLLPVAGGSPRRLGDAVGHDGLWSPDGRRIAWAKGLDVYVSNSDGTEPRRLLSTNRGATVLPYRPTWSPDGRHFRFVLYNAGEDPFYRAIWEASPNGTDLHPLLFHWESPPTQCCFFWTPDGRYFVFTSRRGVASENLWAIREKRGIFGRVGEPVPLTVGPISFWAAILSRDGKTIFAHGFENRFDLTRFDMSSRQFVPYLEGISAGEVSFSRDGQWIAYTAVPGGNLWRARPNGGEKVPLSSLPMQVLGPQWSPDGKRITFSGRMPGGPWKVYLVSTEGLTPPTEALSRENCLVGQWSPDGNSLLMDCANRPSTSEGMGIFVLDIRTHELSSIPDSTGLEDTRWSPDERYIVAHDAHRVRLFDIAQRKWLALVTIDYPNWTVWSRDGRYVYFMTAGNEEALAIYRVRMADRQLEELTSLKNVQPVTDWFSLDPSDSPLIARQTGTDEIYALDWEAP